MLVWLFDTLHRYWTLVTDWSVKCTSIVVHFKFELWRWLMWLPLAYAYVKDVSNVSAVADIIAMARIFGFVNVVNMYLDYWRLSFIGTWFVFIITEFHSYPIFGFSWIIVIGDNMGISTNLNYYSEIWICPNRESRCHLGLLQIIYLIIPSSKHPVAFRDQNLLFCMVLYLPTGERIV